MWALCWCCSSARFGALDWGTVSAHKGSRPMGLVAGGMTNGIVDIWDPAVMAAGKAEDALVTRIEKNRGGITSLQFNPLPSSRHLFATGSSESEVHVINLAKEKYSIATLAQKTGPHPAEISKYVRPQQYSTAPHLPPACAYRVGCVPPGCRGTPRWRTSSPPPPAASRRCGTCGRTSRGALSASPTAAAFQTSRGSPTTGCSS